MVSVYSQCGERFAHQQMPDARDRKIGQENARNIHELLYSIALYPLTHFKGYGSLFDRPQKGHNANHPTSRMPLEEFEELVKDARAEANDPSFKVRQTLVETLAGWTLTCRERHFFGQAYFPL